WHFVKYCLANGVIGGLLGIAGGYEMAGAMTKLYVQFYVFPRLITQLYWTIIVTGLVIRLVFSVLGTLRGVRMILKLAPAEAMRPKPPAKGQRTLVERIRPLWTRLDFRWQMVLRGMFRQRMRSLVGVLASAAGASLLLVTFHL